MKTLESAQASLLVCFANGRGVTPDVLSVAERIIMGLGDSGFSWADSFVRALPEYGTETVWRNLAVKLLIDPERGVCCVVPPEMQNAIRQLATLYEENSDDFEAFKELEHILAQRFVEATDTVTEYAMHLSQLIAKVKWNSNYSPAEPVAYAAYLIEALAATRGETITAEEAFAHIGELVIEVLRADTYNCDNPDAEMCGMCGRYGCERCPNR
jgi:hypothetical protein